MKKRVSVSNRVLYTLIALGILMLIVGGVYAVAPNPGHTGAEIESLPWTKITGAPADGDYCSGGTCTGGIDAPSSSGSGGYISSGGLDGTGTSAFFPSGLYVKGTTSWIYSDLTYLGGPSGDTVSIRENAVTGTSGSSITAGAFYYVSDKSLKTNIQQLPNALDKLKQLNGVSFNWKSDGEKSIGLIAQDVEKVYPESVSTNSEGVKSVDYAKLVAVLIEAVKEQQKQIDELKAKLN